VRGGFGVDEGEQLARNPAVAGRGGVEEARDFGHAGYCTAAESGATPRRIEPDYGPWSTSERALLPAS
jgi:hypothetical protein